MKAVMERVGIVVLSFVLALASNSLTEFLGRDYGAIAVGTPLSVAGQRYVPVDISNFEKQSAGPIILSVPKTTDVSQIASSSPVRLEPIPSNSGAEASVRIKLLEAEPRQMTRLLIPVDSLDAQYLISVVNTEALKMSIERGTTVRSPLWTAFKRALLTTLIYSVLVAGVLFWDYGRIRELTKRLEKVEERDVALKAVITNQGVELRKEYARLRLILLARLTDYAKELDFWRDTVRCILYQTGKGKKGADAAMNSVTDTLRTYSTRTNLDVHEFEAIKAAAAALTAGTPAASPEPPAPKSDAGA